MKRIVLIFSAILAISLFLVGCNGDTEIAEDVPLAEEVAEAEVTVHDRSPEWDAASAALREIMRENGLIITAGNHDVAMSIFESLGDAESYFYRIALVEFTGNELAAMDIEDHKFFAERDGHDFTEFSDGDIGGISFVASGEDMAHDFYVTVTRFDNFVLNTSVVAEEHEPYVAPLIDDLKAFAAEGIPDDFMQEFRNKVVATDRFGDHDSGFLQNARYTRGVGSIFDSISVTLSKRYDSLSEADFEEVQRLQEKSDYLGEQNEFEVVTEEPYLHYWSIEEWIADYPEHREGTRILMYSVTVIYGNLKYQFEAPLEHRETIDTILYQLGF